MGSINGTWSAGVMGGLVDGRITGGGTSFGVLGSGLLGPEGEFTPLAKTNGKESARQTVDKSNLLIKTNLHLLFCKNRK